MARPLSKNNKIINNIIFAHTFPRSTTVNQNWLTRHGISRYISIKLYSNILKASPVPGCVAADHPQNIFDQIN